jgi:hypothetical protein
LAVPRFLERIMNLITDPEFESLCPPLSDEGDRAWTEAQEARVESDQVRLAEDVATMFDDLRALADQHAELHSTGRGSRQTWPAGRRAAAGAGRGGDG